MEWQESPTTRIVRATGKEATNEYSGEVFEVVYGECARDCEFYGDTLSCRDLCDVCRLLECRFHFSKELTDRLKKVKAMVKYDKNKQKHETDGEQGRDESGRKQPKMRRLPVASMCRH